MSRRLALVVALAALAVPAQASAATPLYGLTTDDRLVRMDADRPGWTGRIVPIGGLRAGERAVAIITDNTGEMWIITSASRRYRLDPWSGRLSEVFPGGSLYDGRQFVPGIPADKPVAATPGGGGGDALLATEDELWQPHFAQFTAEKSKLTWGRDDSGALGGSGAPDVVALGTKDSDPRANAVGVDATEDALFLLSATWMYRVGSLGVDVAAPAGLETLDGDAKGLLVSAAPGNRSALHLVDYATGAATAAGETPLGLQLRDVTTVAPPTLMLRTPTLFPGDTAYESGEPLKVPIARVGDPEPSVTAVVRPVPTGPVGSYPDATPGVDYDPTPKAVTFAPGQQMAEARIATVDDDVPEPWEDFSAQLSTDARVPPGGVSIGFTVGDDDAELPPSLVVPEAAATVTIPVIRPATGEGGLQLESQTLPGTATPGADYAVSGATATFAQNATRGAFVLKVNQDARAEGDETVLLTLARTPRDLLTGVSRQVNVTIRDDETTMTVRRRHRLGRLLPVTVACPATCRGTVELRFSARQARRARIGRRQVRRAVVVRAGGKKTLRLRLSRRAVRRLRGIAPVKASLRLSVRPPGAKRPQVVTRTVTLVRLTAERLYAPHERSAPANCNKGSDPFNPCRISRGLTPDF